VEPEVDVEVEVAAGSSRAPVAAPIGSGLARKLRSSSVWVVAAVAALAYGSGVRAMRRRGRPWTWTRTLPFAAGLAVVVVGATLPERSFTSHMAQHVLFGMAAPLLLALGAPVTLALQTAPAGLRASLRHAVHGPAGRLLAHPLVGWLLFGGSMLVLYLTPLLDLSVRNAAVHAWVHVHFLLAGTVFVWPLVGADTVPHAPPFGARLLTVLVAVPFHAFLGLALLSATSPLAPEAYPGLDDQRSAAALLWASGELFTLIIAGIVFAHWLAADRREAARLDRRLAASQTPRAASSR
jgi:putative membrane protein